MEAENWGLEVGVGGHQQRDGGGSYEDLCFSVTNLNRG